MNKKQYFEAPQAELIVVRFEENFLQSDPNAVRNNSASSGYEDENDLGEI